MSQSQNIYQVMRTWFPRLSLLLIPVWAFSYFGKISLIFDLLSNFKVQLLSVALAVVFLHFFFKNRMSLLWSVPLLMILSMETGSWLIPRENTTQKQRPLKVYLANVLGSNLRHQLLLNQIERHEPDLVALLEINDRWAKSLETLKPLYPYSELISREDNFGLSLFSKFELNYVEIQYFSKNKVPSISAQITPSENQTLQLLITHPVPPVSKRSFISRNGSLENMGDYLAQISFPKILLGDLNTAMWSPYYQTLENNAGLYNARKGFGICPTWPASALTKIPLDHCLLSSGLFTQQFKVLESIGSDHLPLLIDILY